MFIVPAAVLSLFCGGVVLVGWLFQNDVLRGAWFGLPPMKANTAAMFMLAGLGFLGMLRSSGNALFKSGTLLCGLLLALGSLAILIEYALAIDLGIDQVLFSDTTGYESLPPGRPALHTCLALLLLGCGLTVVCSGASQRRIYLFAIFLGVSAAALAGFSLVGYLAGAFTGYGWVTKVAINTALLLLLDGAALTYLAWQRSGLDWALSRALTAGFVLATLVTVFMGVLANKVSLQQAQAAAEVSRSQELLGRINDLTADLYRVEDGQRSYLLTGQKEYLEEYIRAYSESTNDLHALRSYSGNDLGIVEVLATLDQALAERVKFAESTMGAFRDQGEAAALQMVKSGAGRRLSEQLIAKLDDFRSNARQSLARGQGQSGQKVAVLQRTLFTGTAFAVLLFAAVFWFLNREILERKRTEQELQSAGAYNRSLIQASPDPLVAIGPDGKITDVNTATEQATGLSHPRLVGTDFCEYFTEPEKARAGYQQAFREGAVRDYPLELRHRNGRRISVLYNAAVYRDQAGQTVGVFAAARDVTESKRIQDALHHANAYNRSLIEASLDPLVTIGPDGRIADVNVATEQATGRARSELVGANFSEYFTDPARAQAGYEKAFREGAVRDYALELRHAKGASTSVIYNASVYRGKTGEIIGVFAAARDVTQQKRAEDALRQSEQRYRSLVQATAQIDWMTDAEGLVHADMPRWREFTGLSLEQVTGDLWLNSIHPEDRQRVAEAWSRAVAEKQSYEVEYRIRRKDGVYRSFWIRGVPIFDSSGSPREWVGACTDITELKKAEENIRRYAEDLQRSNQELEHFAYVASHDLQEPLRGIASFSELLAARYRGRLDQDADEFIGFIVEGAKRMQRLIDDLLSYSRVGTRGKALEPIAAGSALKLAESNLELAIAESGAVITHDPLPTVRGDESQLVQLLQNLLSNAIKFHRQGERPCVHIAATRHNGESEFSVRDNGIGIDPQFFNRLFVIFQRLHSQDQYGGTGIGLAVCKKIVQRHGGRIWIESSPGQGSTFHFTLPAVNPQ